MNEYTRQLVRRYEKKYDRYEKKYDSSKGSHHIFIKGRKHAVLLMDMRGN